MQVELKKIIEKSGRIFEVGKCDRGGRKVRSILRVGSFISVVFVSSGVFIPTRPIVLHVDDLREFLS